MRKPREITFIVIYLVEQLALILLATFQEELTKLWISIFPVVFLSTMAIERTLLTAKHEIEMKEMSKLLEGKKSEEKLDKDFKEFRTDHFKRYI